MKKILILMLAMIVMLPIVFATDITIVNQPIILWANFGLNESIVNITSANVTIKNPTLLTIVNNQAMTQNGSQTFFYNLTPNLSGTYLMTVTYMDNGGTFYIDNSTFYAREDNTMMIGLLIGLIALAIYFIYVGKDLMTRPTAVDENKGIQKWLNTQTLGLFTYLLSSWIVLAIVFVMERLSVGNITHPFFETLFTTFLMIIVLLNVGYWIFFVIFKIVSSLKAGVRHR
jgi:hypothetical protein